MQTQLCTYRLHTLACSVEVRIPIHFRYQPPSVESAYVSVRVPAPMLLVPHPLGSASLPCHAGTRDTCPWAVVSLAAGEHDDNDNVGVVMAQIPRGLEGWLSSFVIITTCLVPLVAMFAIIRTMHTSTSSLPSQTPSQFTHHH